MALSIPSAPWPCWADWKHAWGSALANGFRDASAVAFCPVAVEPSLHCEEPIVNRQTLGKEKKLKVPLFEQDDVWRRKMPRAPSWRGDRLPSLVRGCLRSGAGVPSALWAGRLGSLDLAEGLHSAKVRPPSLCAYILPLARRPGTRPRGRGG